VAHVLFTLFISLRIVLSNTYWFVLLVFVVFVLRFEDCPFLIAPSAVSNLYEPITFNLPDYCLYRTSQSVPMMTNFIYLTICIIQTPVYYQQCYLKRVPVQHGKTIGDYVLH
jgi:hypothetical protein